MATPAYITRSIRYTVPSRSGGEPHTVTVDPYDARTACTCTAGSFAKDCHAQRAVRAGTAGKPRVRITAKPAHRPVSALYHTSAAELEV